MSITTLLLVLLTAFPLSYAQARFGCRRANVILALFAIALPKQLLVIPLYELEANLNIINTC